MQLTGDVTLLRRMHTLPARLQKKHGRRALTKAGRLVVAAAKPHISSSAADPLQQHPRTGALKKSLGQRGRTYGDTVVQVVGPRIEDFAVSPNPYSKKYATHDPGKIAHLVERDRPFLRPAYDATRGTTKAVIAAELAKGIEEEARKS